MAEKHMPVLEKTAERELETWNPFRMLDPLREFRLFPLGGLRA